MEFLESEMSFKALISWSIMDFGVHSQLLSEISWLRSHSAIWFHNSSSEGFRTCDHIRRISAIFCLSDLWSIISLASGSDLGKRNLSFTAFEAWYEELFTQLELLNSNSLKKQKSCWCSHSSSSIKSTERWSSAVGDCSVSHLSLDKLPFLGVGGRDLPSGV